jgi:hypothetical protein
LIPMGLRTDPTYSVVFSVVEIKESLAVRCSAAKCNHEIGAKADGAVDTVYAVSSLYSFAFIL